MLRFSQARLKEQRSSFAGFHGCLNTCASNWLSGAGIPRCPAQASSLHCPVPPTLNRAGHLPTTRPRGLNHRFHPIHHFSIPSLGVGRAGVPLPTSPPPQVFLKVFTLRVLKLQPREGHLKAGWVDVGIKPVWQ